MKYDNELPLGKRKPLYRFFEMVPAILSYVMIILMIVLAFVSPFLAAVYLLLLIISMLVRAVGIAYHTIKGYTRMECAQKIHWDERLADLEDAEKALVSLRAKKSHAVTYDHKIHLENIRKVANNSSAFPKPSSLYHAVIIAAYNEPIEVIEPTIQSLLESTTNPKQLMIVFAYEERGGLAIKKTVEELRRKYGHHFNAFLPYAHPSNLPNEVAGKGPNITYAAQRFREYIDEEREQLPYEDIIVTTLDCDNKPYPSYFDYVAYEYIVHEDRKRLSYQPVCLYTGNIWDAPAPMRVIATGNSFWTIISSMREHLLRNFASHSQSMDALVEMNFWSKRSIVEDGHQYWRSYFHFKGDYGVIPIHVPVYQDAVMADTLKKTFITQFKQLRRWSYGASDVPFVATRLFTRNRIVPFWGLVSRFIRLIDSHVSLAGMAILIAIGGWIPLLVNPEASRSIAAHNLPVTISIIQQVAMVGLFITIFFSFRILPPRPARYKRSRNLWMVVQWALMPFTSVLYGSAAAYAAQTRLLVGSYLEKFDVTEKANISTVQRDKKVKKAPK